VIPMNVRNDATNMAKTLIGEPSFADAMAAIEKAEHLSRIQKRHWSTSLRQVGRYLDRPSLAHPDADRRDRRGREEASSGHAQCEPQDLHQSPSQCKDGTALVQPTAA
jgi:hypothetical protein